MLVIAPRERAREPLRDARALFLRLFTMMLRCCSARDIVY